jgi:hypothetical protein
MLKRSARAKEGKSHAKTQTRKVSDKDGCKPELSGRIFGGNGRLREPATRTSEGGSETRVTQLWRRHGDRKECVWLRRLLDRVTPVRQSIRKEIPSAGYPACRGHGSVHQLG